jgi:hypothetical protein
MAWPWTCVSVRVGEACADGASPPPQYAMVLPPKGLFRLLPTAP